MPRTQTATPGSWRALPGRGATHRRRSEASRVVGWSAQRWRANSADHLAISPPSVLARGPVCMRAPVTVLCVPPAIITLVELVRLLRCPGDHRALVSVDTAQLLERLGEAKRLDAHYADEEPEPIRPRKRSRPTRRVVD